MPAIYKNGLLYAGTSGGSGANTDIIADEYTEKAYAVGDYCIHEDALYKCNTAITVAESWTAAHWTEKDIATELKAINNTISTLGTASTKNVPSSGNAGNTEVVLGNDTRLTDARPANDVYDWAKASTKPSYTASEVGALPSSTTIPTITDTYSGTSSDGMSGKAVKSAIDALDVSAVGGSGKYISTISEADGKISATAENIDTIVTNGSSNLVTSGAVFTAIGNLPKPMILKGTLGTNGTITTLPTATSLNEGYTYKVITAGTYSSQAAKVGDLFTSTTLDGSTYTWLYIPAGDDVEDTWRNIKVNGVEKLGVGISTGAVDFVDGTNTTASFDITGNKISFSVPAVSSTNAGVAPQGAAVSSQNQTTKFLREDGSWAAPSYTDASGFMTKANPAGTGSFSMNRAGSTTVGDYSSTLGDDCTASGNYSHAEGASTKATGHYSHAEGRNTLASGNNSHAEGYDTTASGTNSHAEGSNTTASGGSSHAEGNSTIASGTRSHAEGYLTTAQRQSQHVFGEYNILDTTGTTTTRGDYVEIVGNGTSSARSNARTLDWNGNEVLAGTLTTTGVNLPSGSTWDGTNTSLASAISAIRSNMYNIPVDPSDTSNMNIWIETT